jgi:hypothetical protein
VFKESITETVSKILKEDLEDSHHDLSDDALVE